MKDNKQILQNESIVDQINNLQNQERIFSLMFNGNEIYVSINFRKDETKV